MSKTPIRARREWSFLPYREHKDAATGLVHNLPPVVIEDGIGAIASCGFGGPDHDNEAFARLMSAAPELLAAVEGLLKYIGREHACTAAAEARAAITKATGV